MPTLSILTSAYAPTATYLAETIDSVAKQALPDNWHLEWVVQEDGNAPQLADKFRELPFVRYGANGRQMGPAYTRNLALSRVTGQLVQVLDHDDLLLPGGLATLLAAFESYPIHWAVGQADDLLPDGTRASYDSAMAFGVLPAGSVNDWAIAHGGNWPIHCAGLMIRTATVRALGGWAGIPVDDDISMFAALSEITDGYNEPMLTWLYRHHAQQTHKSETWKARSNEGRQIALERVAAIRHARLAAGQVDGSDLHKIGGPTFQAGDLDPNKLRHEAD